MQEKHCVHLNQFLLNVQNEAVFLHVIMPSPCYFGIIPDLSSDELRLKLSFPHDFFLFSPEVHFPMLNV